MLCQFCYNERNILHFERKKHMKRLFALLLAVLMLLCACGGEPAETTGSTDASTTESTSTETTTDTTDTTPQQEALYRHPLTGAPLYAPYTGRPTAVVINNIKACMPQSGLLGADMIYEIETEGGITRLLAIFSELEKVQNIGPVRSARTYFINLAASYDLPLIHCGGSVNALDGRYDETNKLNEWDHIDQRFNGSYFYRDKDRRKAGYAYEHTLFTTGEKLLAAVAKKGFDDVYENGTNYGLQFADEVNLNGETANTVTVDFRGKKTTTMTYDADLGLYLASQYGKKHIDENSGETVSYRNVLVLRAKQWSVKEGSYNRSYYNLIGSGEGYFACDGKIVPIKWSRKTVNDQFSYTLADGTPITLGVGRSYIGIIHTGDSAGVTYK